MQEIVARVNLPRLVPVLPVRCGEVVLEKSLAEIRKAGEKPRVDTAAHSLV